MSNNAEYLYTKLAAQDYANLYLAREGLSTILELARLMNAKPNMRIEEYMFSLDLPQSRLLEQVLYDSINTEELENAHFDFEEV